MLNFLCVTNALQAKANVKRYTILPKFSFSRVKTFAIRVYPYLLIIELYFRKQFNTRALAAVVDLWC
jgi:hypothetical protein